MSARGIFDGESPPSVFGIFDPVIFDTLLSTDVIDRPVIEVLVHGNSEKTILWHGDEEKTIK